LAVKEDVADGKGLSTTEGRGSPFHEVAGREEGVAYPKAGQDHFVPTVELGGGCPRCWSRFDGPEFVGRGVQVGSPFFEGERAGPPCRGPV
jgi:hypothetical protein